MNFFVRIKRAIINFDEYQNFSMEKLSISIKYFVRLMLIFSLILAAVLTYKTYVLVDNSIKMFEETFPDFVIDENNELILENEKESYILEDQNGYFAIIADNQETEVQEMDYETAIVMLKDKIVIKNRVLEIIGKGVDLTYEELSSDYNVKNITKQNVIDNIKEVNWIVIYVIFFIIGLVYNFLVYSILALIDVLLLSILGFLISRMFKISLKYKVVLIMSFYAVTLPIILSLIYFSVNLLTGFEIKYFRVAYDAISYIYIITAILIIKSDLIKQQMELIKIVEVQKQVKEEMERKKEEEDKEEKKDKEKENDVEADIPDNTSEEGKKKKDLKPKVEPEGSQAAENLRM